ncbi:putative zn(2)-C6 fungal-type DNA-binding domain, fungal transcription factor [Septoria linicola]|nr:putative zn(2)-C6 fungal-type DNA-binding domain, fungal transcription factor [Septoria linicola]
MAEGSPLPFPSPSAILGENHTSPPATTSAAAAATALNAEPARRPKHARSPSKRDNAKKAVPKKAVAVEADAGPDSVKGAKVDKPKQTKSRNGCSTCKAKRLKCGEEKPGCLNCSKRNVPCGGYKKVFQWRDYGSQQIRTNIVGQKQATSRITPPREASTGSPLSTTPTGEPPNIFDIPRSNPNADEQQKPRRKAPRRTKDNDDEPIQLRQRQQASNSPPKDDHNRSDSAFVRVEEVRPSPGSQQTEETTSPPDDSVHGHPMVFNPDSNFVFRTRSLSPGDGRRPSPTLTEMMLQDGHNLNTSPLDFVPFSLPEDYQLPLFSTGPNDPIMDNNNIFDDIDLIGPIQPMDMDTFMWPSRLQTPASPGASPIIDLNNMWHGAGPNPWGQPDLPFDSEEILMTRFVNMTCGVLSVIDGPSENPWRSLIMPLAKQSTGLHHAILALAAFHGAQDQPRLRFVGGHHKNIAVTNIREGLRDDTMMNHAAIATALALAFVEAWESHVKTGNAHINGAAALVKKALDYHHQEPHQGEDLARLKFLCNAWVYMDVIARVTAVDANDSTDFTNALWPPNETPDVAIGHDEPGFGINFGMGIDARLDPLMGCAGTLFPLIGHVANLVRKVCRSQRNPIGIISQARDLMESLEQWEPPAYIERPEDPLTDVRHALQTAEAYRYATMLHLHQSVPELPTPLSDEQYAQRVLQYLATVPLNSRMLLVHIYPLMIAGCQAVESEDRDWIRQRWGVMNAQMRIGIIDKCVALTEEVWRRRDSYEARPPEKRRLVATADLQSVRNRGSPLTLHASDIGNTEPGRTGMVFSLADFDGTRSPPATSDGAASRIDRRPPRDRNPEMALGKIDMAYTVRGHISWVGVMWDWAWEVLLG